MNFKRVGLKTMKITHNSQNSSMKPNENTQKNSIIEIPFFDNYYICCFGVLLDSLVIHDIISLFSYSYQISNNSKTILLCTLYPYYLIIICIYKLIFRLKFKIAWAILKEKIELPWTTTSLFAKSVSSSVWWCEQNRLIHGTMTCASFESC